MKYICNDCILKQAYGSRIELLKHKWTVHADIYKTRKSRAGIANKGVRNRERGLGKKEHNAPRKEPKAPQE